MYRLKSWPKLSSLRLSTDQGYLEYFSKVNAVRRREQRTEFRKEISRFHGYSCSSKRNLLPKNINISRNVMGLHFWLTIQHSCYLISLFKILQV